MKDSTARRLSRLHTFAYRATGGLIGRRLVSNDMLLLTTRGLASGRRHTVPLLYLKEDDTLVVIASWGGRDRHPDWYLNLAAEPRAEIQIRGRRRPVMARTAESDERAAWWPRIVEAYGGYREYQNRTERTIPVVMLEPRPARGRRRPGPARSR